jgi:hypothetical protein
MLYIIGIAGVGYQQNKLAFVKAGAILKEPLVAARVNLRRRRIFSV